MKKVRPSGYCFKFINKKLIGKFSREKKLMRKISHMLEKNSEINEKFSQ